MIGSMRNRYSKILCLLLLFMCCLPQDGNAIWPFKKKKKEEKKEVLTPYQKLFKNKKVQTAHGLMTIQNRTTDLLVHIITYNIDIKHNSCSEFLCVIVIIIPSSPFSFKRYLLEYVRKCVFYDQVCD